MTEDSQAPSGIQNCHYCVTVHDARRERIALRVAAVDIQSDHARAARVMAFAHELAANIRQRSAPLNVGWTVLVDPSTTPHVVIQIPDPDRDAGLAYKMLERVFAERAEARNRARSARGRT